MSAEKQKGTVASCPCPFVERVFLECFASLREAKPARVRRSHRWLPAAREETLYLPKSGK